MLDNVTYCGQRCSSLVSELVERARTTKAPATCLVEAMAMSDKCLTATAIMDEAIEVLIGKGEAIGHALLSAIYELIKSPSTRSKLRAELGGNRVNIGTVLDVQQFPYLVRFSKIVDACRG